MVSHYFEKFGDHRHCGSGDIMFLVAEEETSLDAFASIAPSLFNIPLLVI